jgi:hypothetical protein
MTSKEPDAADAGFTLSNPPPAPDSGSGALPKVDFSTFVISLATSALFHMGIAGDPEKGEPPPKNLVLAKQTIDTLEMLAEKTRGNLDDEEAKLLKTVLYEVHMRFVEAGK